MTRKAGCNRRIPALVALALAAATGAGGLSSAQAQSSETPQQFWHIPVWAVAGAWQDNTAEHPRSCAGLLDPRPDSLSLRSRTVTVRFLRSRRVEARSDFGGYRVYRCTNDRDTTTAVLLRRYSLNSGDKPLWHFSRVDTTDATTLPFKCGGIVANDSVLTFVDPDSSGALVKVCPYPTPGECIAKRDSIWALMNVPGPHDGFRTWYTVTYEAKNTFDNNFGELFVPDTGDGYARCLEPGVPGTCPNLNSKLGNMTVEAVEPNGGPTGDLQTVLVVPNPYRGREAWDPQSGHEVHFTNLPSQAKIRVYTVSGDLVRELKHDATVRGSDRYNEDFERWDLKNANGRDVVSGIYMYRVESGVFFAQGRFVVIR